MCAIKVFQTLVAIFCFVFLLEGEGHRSTSESGMQWILSFPKKLPAFVFAHKMVVFNFLELQMFHQSDQLIATSHDQCQPFGTNAT